MADDLTRGMLQSEADHAKRDAVASLARAEASIADLRRLLEKGETGLNMSGEYARPMVDALTYFQRWASAQRAIDLLEIEKQARERPPAPVVPPGGKTRRKKTT